MLLPTYPVITPPTLKKLCCYLNSTHKMQLVRLSDKNNCRLEKVVFPLERLLFEANPNKKLEVYVEQNGREILQENIDCNNLQID